VLRGALTTAAVVTALVLATPAAAAPDVPPWCDWFEERDALVGKLARHDAEAVPLLLHAYEALDREDLTAASDRLKAVRKRAPRFHQANRLRCEVEIQRGSRRKAVDLCRLALREEDTVRNQRSLALALATPDPLDPPGARDLAEAADVAMRASMRAPDDVGTQLDLCDVALQAGDARRLEQCTTRLDVLLPDAPSTLYFAAWSAAWSGRTRLARSRLSEALDAGLPQEIYDADLPLIEATQSPLASWVETSVELVAAWFGILLVLLLWGEGLSRASSAAATRILSEPDRGDDAGLIGGLTRRLYRAVLWALCVHWYLTVLAVTVGFFWLGASLIRWILGFSVIRLWMLGLIITALTYVAGALVRTLTARVDSSGDPGFALRVDGYPSLLALLHEVAAKVGTAPVDRVFLVPDTTFAVFERGSTLRQLGGARERCLVVGVALLDGLRVIELKSILAHEYGHFRGGDTSAGVLALAVRRSMEEAAISLHEAGLARWYNPAWWFIVGFHAGFVRISPGASRLQEVLADRASASAYGSDARARSLRHSVRTAVRFHRMTDALVDEVVDARGSLRNLYRRKPERPPTKWTLEKAEQDALKREPDAWDTHPPTASRIAWMDAMEGGGDSMPGDEADSWALFGDRTGVEVEMTRLFRRNLALATGIDIPEAGRRIPIGR